MQIDERGKCEQRNRKFSKCIMCMRNRQMKEKEKRQNEITSMKCCANDVAASTAIVIAIASVNNNLLSNDTVNYQLLFTYIMRWTLENCIFIQLTTIVVQSINRQRKKNGKPHLHRVQIYELQKEKYTQIRFPKCNGNSTSV